MTAGADSALLWRIPVGAGSSCSARIVARTSAVWEAAEAALRGRERRKLVHAALELTVDGIRRTVEMTPAWGQPPGPRGVVATGPVGSRALGGVRLFRYEVRCWAGGVIPDLAWAVDDPVPLPAASARAVRDALPQVPRLVWGRRPRHVADMWNSNSLVAWALARAGVDAASLAPPPGTRAPGWAAGVVVAARSE